MGLPKTILTEDEYLAFERDAEERHIYVDGEVFAMAGGSPAHHTICTNVVVSLGTSLETVRAGCGRKMPASAAGRCRNRPNGSTGLYSYPDVIVICDEPKFLDEHEDVLLNPKALVEVLSESTEAFDRGDKLPLSEIQSLAHRIHPCQPGSAADRAFPPREGRLLELHHP